MIGKNTIQKPSIDKAIGALHDSRHNTCVVFDSLESTPDIKVQVKTPFNTSAQTRHTNQQISKQKSYQKKKTKSVAALLESLSTGNNGSKCKGWNLDNETKEK